MMMGANMTLATVTERVIARLNNLLFPSRSPYGNYAGAVAASLAASRAAFNDYKLLEATTSIDVKTATIQEMVLAYKDCQRCLAIEYPETAEGCGRCDHLMSTIEAAVTERFPQIVPPFPRSWWWVGDIEC